MQQHRLHRALAFLLITAPLVGRIGGRAGGAEPTRIAVLNKILEGARPADFPVEVDNKIELTINLKVARMLGLTVPPELLSRADRVIR